MYIPKVNPIPRSEGLSRDEIQEKVSRIVELLYGLNKKDVSIILAATTDLVAEWQCFAPPLKYK